MATCQDREEGTTAQLYRKQHLRHRSHDLHSYITLVQHSPPGTTLCPQDQLLSSGSDGESNIMVDVGVARAARCTSIVGAFLIGATRGGSV